MREVDDPRIVRVGGVEYVAAGGLDDNGDVVLYRLVDTPPGVVEFHVRRLAAEHAIPTPRVRWYIRHDGDRLAGFADHEANVIYLALGRALWTASHEVGHLVHGADECFADAFAHLAGAV